jgi:hypothetical protein
LTRTHFRREVAINTSQVTTGLAPLVIGSVDTFQQDPKLNRLPWDLTGGTATLTLQDPNGVQTVLSAQVLGFGAKVAWTVAGAIGTWTRAWTLIDGSGLKQVSRPRPFVVTGSP